ncbi:MAG TPA: nicotinate-nucleotide adenylyltransferase [Pirellulaceae bacterium]|nr:nicotinate-nucleotide adenylyltransferase [Pirellulaceae bacterium]HMO93345.1 nicotinate-nucleotide adenylyltransferase [Pirellulaceae bacterium]HMP70116.1 nicotinate-nucleotide adenylyltransferase [Pirellulaceae bacterium]
MKIGIFGGSFDPIHYGHLILAEQCRDQANLDQVWFVPTSVSPFKSDGSKANAKHRVEMLQLAIAGHDQFHVSTLEIDRGGKSYTVETLEEIQRGDAHHELFLFVGMDAFQSFRDWRNPQRILELATPMVFRRSGTTLDFQVLKQLCDENRALEIEAFQIDLPLIEISSTHIRESVHHGRSIRYMVPRAVELYIFTHRLYANTPAPS